MAALNAASWLPSRPTFELYWQIQQYTAAAYMNSAGRHIVQAPTGWQPRGTLTDSCNQKAGSKAHLSKLSWQALGQLLKLVKVHQVQGHRVDRHLHSQSLYFAAWPGKSLAARPDPAGGSAAHTQALCREALNCSQIWGICHELSCINSIACRAAAQDSLASVAPQVLPIATCLDALAQLHNRAAEIVSG